MRGKIADVFYLLAASCREPGSMILAFSDQQ